MGSLWLAVAWNSHGPKLRVSRNFFNTFVLTFGKHNSYSITNFKEQIQLNREHTRVKFDPYEREMDACIMWCCSSTSDRNLEPPPAPPCERILREENLPQNTQRNGVKITLSLLSNGSSVSVRLKGRLGQSASYAQTQSCPNQKETVMIAFSNPVFATEYFSILIFLHFVQG